MCVLAASATSRAAADSSPYAAAIASSSLLGGRTPPMATANGSVPPRGWPSRSRRVSAMSASDARSIGRHSAGGMSGGGSFSSACERRRIGWNDA